MYMYIIPTISLWGPPIYFSAKKKQPICKRKSAAGGLRQAAAPPSAAALLRAASVEGAGSVAAGAEFAALPGDGNGDFNHGMVGS